MRLAALLVLLPALLCVAVGQEKRERYSDEAAGFSFVLPPGWKVTDAPAGKYRVAYGPRADDFTPNIFVTDDRYPGAVEDYAVVAQHYMEASPGEFGLDAVKFAGSAEFKTDAGRAGVKLSNDVRAMGKDLIFRQYVFEGRGGLKLVFTCGALASDVSDAERLCDASMKSLTFTR